MEPNAYLLPRIESEYAAEHPELTDAARELLHAEIRSDPAKYARSSQTRALVSYAEARTRLIHGYTAIAELPDEEFEPRRERLFEQARRSLATIVDADPRCVEARLLDILLGGRTYDDCIRDMLALEQETRGYLQAADESFDAESPVLAAVPDPIAVGWLHTVDALSLSCLATARYRAALSYARTLMHAAGYPAGAEGPAFLALARLEDEQGFFETVDACRERGIDVEQSPWFLLGRSLLFYKLGKGKQARRAMRDFALRADGGAYFLESPVFPTPYLPVRPAPATSWEPSQQAVYEADGILIDTPDFVPWASSIEETERAADEFARRNGFMF